MATTNVYGVNGGVAGTVEVPEAFATPYRPDIIKKAVLAAAANGRQPYGPGARSGMRHAVSFRGKGTGSARNQRIHGLGKAGESPNNVSGRRAHPPVPERIWAQKVNKKEAKIARASALAATGCADCVKARGHQFDDSVSFPIVIEDSLNDVKETSAVIELFEKIGIGYDLDRAKDGRKIRAGRGTMRNRKYRTPVSVLIVVADEERNSAIFKSAANIPGVTVEEVKTLNTSILAPGGDAGRLTVYTKAAIDAIGGWTQ
ncbi:MAG: 50S ribosomal protein L4 [Candidatus Methanomethylophilaceae archaeon]|nr:50S ribosomal protein L4 [Candidatus Methanomethylophilaceae archaeon]MBQ9690061.1 50S ribosomal protein L4 [Candidatus Methanomethylophilaceae archaeon]MBR6911970.1 50S ribosomal protein L4 [Candidatus Methanomethylophilaceae archaeon]